MQTAAAVKIDPAKLTPEQHRQLWAVQQQEVTARRRELAGFFYTRRPPASPANAKGALWRCYVLLEPN